MRELRKEKKPLDMPKDWALNLRLLTESLPFNEGPGAHFAIGGDDLQEILALRETRDRDGKTRLGRRDITLLVAEYPPGRIENAKRDIPVLITPDCHHKLRSALW